MKKIFLFSLIATTVVFSATTYAQEDKSKRPSPPAKASVRTANGNMISINYSQPAIKGRTMGKEIAPFDKVWRTGANEATTFEITKDAKIQGKYLLPKGKYSLYTIPTAKTWTVIFNKKWNQWGTEYNQGDDALRVTTDAVKSGDFTERMTFKLNKEGKVKLMWGNTELGFLVN